MMGEQSAILDDWSPETGSSSSVDREKLSSPDSLSLGDRGRVVVAIKALPIEDMEPLKSAAGTLPESLLALLDSVSLSDVDWSETCTELPGSSWLTVETLASNG